MTENLELTGKRFFTIYEKSVGLLLQLPCRGGLPVDGSEGQTMAGRVFSR
jgi:hypothetical protein